jgi:hypothetical protein
VSSALGDEGGGNEEAKTAAATKAREHYVASRSLFGDNVVDDPDFWVGVAKAALTAAFTHTWA